MDTDQIKGKLQNAFGKVEEVVGEAVGSKNLSSAGAEDRVKGSATETWGNAKDTVRDVRDTVRTDAAAHEEHTAVQEGSLRDRIATGSEHLKDSINAKLDNVKTHDADKRDDIF